MNRRAWLSLVLVFVAIAVAVGAFEWRAARWASVDANKLLRKALLRDADSDYIAYVTAATGYSGRVTETNATVFQKGSTQKVAYGTTSGRDPWSMTVDGKSYSYLPKTNQLLVTETSRMLSKSELSKLLFANYRARCTGIDTIAGRRAYIVEIVSRHTKRIARRLWIDREHGLVLRSDEYSASGDRRASTAINKVAFDAQIHPETLSLPSAEQVDYKTVCTSAESADRIDGLGFRVGRPGYVPAGYRLEGYHVLHSTCGCKHRSAQLTYTDGLNVISVFQAPRERSCCKMSSGACDDQNCGIATLGQVTRGNKVIVVVGDLLPKEIRKIAESVR